VAARAPCGCAKATPNTKKRTNGSFLTSFKRSSSLAYRMRPKLNRRGSLRHGD
jgi:hypothetical protein